MLKRRSQLRFRRRKFRGLNIGVTREVRIQTLGTKTLGPCAQNLILRLQELTRTTCHISQIIHFFFNAFSICGTQELILFLKVGTHLIMLNQLGAHILAHLF
jgi:hypothetical protein